MCGTSTSIANVAHTERAYLRNIGIGGKSRKSQPGFQQTFLNNTRYLRAMHREEVSTQIAEQKLAIFES